MQYADIALNSKTANIDLFTYKIPADQLPYVGPGSVVEVNLGRRKVLGVIFKIKRQIRGISKKQIKPIIRVIDSSPILDQSRLEIAKTISNYQISSLGKVVFSMIPEPARRIGTKKPKSINFANNNKENQVLVSIGSFKERLKLYQQIIKKNSKNNNRTLILTSNINSANAKSIEKTLPQVTTYHSKLRRTEKYKIWQKGRSGNINVLLGSHQALFVPIPKLSLIIVDQTTESLYKNQQEPFFDYRNLTLILSKKINATVIFADQLPYFNHYLKIKTKRWKVIRANKPAVKTKKTSIINLNKEKSLLSLPLKRELSKTLSANKKALLFLNRTGDRNIGICSKCQNPHYNLESTSITCQKCQSDNINYVSLGVTGLKKIVSQEFPKAKILELQSSNNKSKNNQIEEEKYDILISTSAINQFNINFDLVSLVLPDISLNLPTYNSEELSFYQLFKVLKLSKNRLIQTFNPESKLLSDLCRLDYQSFFDRLIKSRKDNDQPPFSVIIKIYSQKKPYQETLTTTREEIIMWKQKNNLNLTLTPIVNPVFFKWPYFLIKLDQEPPKKLKNKLASLPVKADRNPISLI